MNDDPTSSPARWRELLGRRISLRMVRTVLFALLGLAVVGVGVGLVAVRELSKDLPSPARLQTIKPPIKTLLFAANGDTLHEYYRENRNPIRLDDVPPGLVQAIIATEDRGFYDHYGIQLRGIARAAIANLREGRKEQGASTLTQQLARSLFLHPRKEWTRKVREMLLALQIERAYTKDEILEMYLNAIYFGPAYGVEAASIAFFGKSARDLEPSEYTFLAGVLNNPGYYSPFRHLDRAYQRRAVVLRSMVDAGVLSEAEAESIGQSEVSIRPDQSREPVGAYFVETIRQYLEEHYGVKQLYEEGLRVYTTLDPAIQARAEQALEEHLAKIEKQERYEHTKAEYDTLYADVDEPPVTQYIQGAVMVMDPSTGAVRALVGGRDFASSKFNRALQAQRQPGSVFKPFLYTAALQQGWNAASVLLDAPVEIDTGADELWRPVNFDPTFQGEVPVRYALANSINVPAVRLILEVGTQPVIQLAHRMGITSRIPDVYSIALGAGEANLAELVTAYTVFANNGIRTRPFYFTKITNARDEVLEESRIYQEEVLDERTNYMIVDLMRSALREGTGRAVASYGFDRDGAGKTGTTDRYTDAWFIGYTPDLVCGVWVGFDTQKSMGKRKTGAVMALPIWARIMVPTLAELPPSYFVRPEGMVDRLVCTNSGQRPSANCLDIVSELFIEGQEPARTCEIHQPGSPDVRRDAGDFQAIDADASRRDEFGGLRRRDGEGGQRR